MGGGAVGWSGMPAANLNNVTRGVFLMMSAITVFTVMSAFIKAADRVPAGEAMFFRSLMAMPIVLIWLVTHGGIRAGIRTE